VARSSFRGTQRFELVRLLGRGANGAVYEAIDREHHARVALKVLAEQSHEAIAHFKNEFRSLQGVRHKNLVELNELLFDEGHWLLSMELVRGTDIVSYVRGASPEQPRTGQIQAAPEDETLRARSSSASEHGVPALPGSFVAGRLGAFSELADGLNALHAANKIHRDLKPSNVLVDTNGRVVILDFGLVADLGALGSVRHEHVLGTPRYMAPEQATLRQAGPPSDWYGVGMMLYQSLTGRLPDDASEADGSLALHDVAPGALGKLVRELLAHDPGKRAGYADVLACLSAGNARKSGPPPGASFDSFFVGRRAELSALHEAFARTQHGEPLTIVVEGESGVGKTSLIERFRHELCAEEPRALTFAGRCFERESLPYKAIDGVMDSVCSYLSELPVSEAARLLPDNARAMAQAFPALHRLDAVLGGPTSSDPIEPQVQRLRIFAALRELFARLARTRPLALIIDDMQWADIDSMTLLSFLLRPPNAPRLLLIALRRPRLGIEQTPLPGQVSELALGPLSREEASTLVRRLLESHSEPGVSDERVHWLADEARGHPLFLREIVQETRTAGAVSASTRLEDALWHRVETLDGPARQLVELTCVAGKPIAQRTMLAALTHAEPSTAAMRDAGHPSNPTAELRHACLIRTSGSHPSDTIEPYHDRVREAVLGHLSPDRLKERHACLAQALERAEQRDAEGLAVHWQGAGDLARAQEFGLLAAEQAAHALAFERAARLYRVALSLAPLEPAVFRVHSKNLGDALTNAGRGLEAAQAYQAAARGAPALEGSHLERLAAEPLLRSGYIEQGIRSVSKVLQHMGIATPKHRITALVSFGLLRAHLRLRGFHYEQRAADEISPLELERIDSTWTAAICLTMFDNVRSAELQCKNTLLALRAGTPLQVLRAHTAEAMFLGLGGQSNRQRIERLLGAARELATELGHPHAHAWVALSRGATSFFLGEWQQGQRECKTAEAFFHQQPGALFELGSARAFRVWSSMMRGEFREVLKLVPGYIEEAESRGDLYAATYQMTGFSNVAWLSEDNVREARSMLALAEQRWPTEQFDVPRYMDLVAAAHIELYDGTGPVAYRRVLRDWASLRWGVAFRAQITRFGMRFVRGLSALAAYDARPDRRLVRDALICARDIARERVVWSSCFSEILLSGVATRRHAPDQALAHLELAEQHAEATGMALHRAVVRHRRGELLGGDQGRALMAEAQAFMVEQEIRRPERMLDMLSPTVRPA
jgi:hypothetical protein